MRLNTLSFISGTKQKKTRLGRGRGSGLGKTCGRGHKGQKARAGGYHKVGFEGGQLPIQRRLPKIGFISLSAKGSIELRLDQISRINADVLSIDSLVHSGLISKRTKRVKIIASGKIDKAVTLHGIQVSTNARLAIEELGGKVNEKE
ncbi:50S ribosomal protein L15 [Candidatus Nitrosacidococcus tergens]|uniref:Large ribosomal subunit protein uL15 n=1 Tax=Candidatus Nitrosacidococcus tergens TaxID=553981 RepID=A0A7G1Q8M0_9GAMM|nr:50S ribosomal protein L15 [Candidatus Nitrosacidococcus tergens]CAB1274846.1 50S ribosomal subunit protein L15 [Candidatus Nitrosacidococcus tergens]